MQTPENRTSTAEKDIEMGKFAVIPSICQIPIKKAISPSIVDIIKQSLTATPIKEEATRNGVDLKNSKVATGKSKNKGSLNRSIRSSERLNHKNQEDEVDKSQGSSLTHTEILENTDLRGGDQQTQKLGTFTPFNTDVRLDTNKTNLLIYSQNTDI